MRVFKTISGAMLMLSALLVAGLFAATTRADQWNNRTIVKFSGPVEVPADQGPEVLPAGTYMFKLLNSDADRNIVQIFNKNQTHLYATVLAIPDYHLNTPSHTLIRLYKSKNGNPAALKAWFYPGDNFGQRFVYPKSRATEIARNANEAVPSMPDDTAANMSKIKSGNEPEASALKNAQVKAEEPSGQEVAAAQVVQSKPSSSSHQNSNPK
jgi:hypothetical protein